MKTFKMSKKQLANHEPALTHLSCRVTRIVYADDYDVSFAIKH